MFAAFCPMWEIMAKVVWERYPPKKASMMTTPTNHIKLVFASILLFPTYSGVPDLFPGHLVVWGVVN